MGKPEVTRRVGVEPRCSLVSTGRLYHPELWFGWG